MNRGEPEFEPMILDLLRHGEALAAGTAGDRERPLSPAGVGSLRALGARLATERWRPERAFSSDYVRARGSLAILSEGISHPPSGEELRELAPETDPDEALRAVAARAAGAQHVLVVSHQPLLGRMVAHLTGETRPLAPGTLVRIECD